MSDHALLGTSIPRIEGPAKVTGAARFAADIEQAGIAFGRLLRSPYAHARIKRVDVTRALKHPGVLAVVTGSDVAGLRTGKNLADMPVLCWDVVRYIGDPIAAICRRESRRCRRGLGAHRGGLRASAARCRSALSRARRRT